MSKVDHSLKVSHGVETLIERLRDEGVAAGREQGQRIVAEAEAKARQVMEQAGQEANDIRLQARKEVEHTRKSLEEAIRVAVRDSILDLKGALASRFAEEVQQAVGAEMHKHEMLQRLILEVAGRAREQIDETEPVTVLLPRDVIGLEELRKDPAALRASPLTELAGFITKDMLREGIGFQEGDHNRPGIRIALKQGRILLDLTDKAVAELLLDHLQPRFRALVEGIVR